VCSGPGRPSSVHSGRNHALDGHDGSVSWPPTQMVAPSTCRKSRMVVQLTGSTQVARAQGSNSTLTAPVRRRRAIVRMACFQSRNG
jgi:hypothetical protein